MSTELSRIFHAGTRPTIVCLCGSGRFRDEFERVAHDLTMAGEIVLSIGFVPRAGRPGGSVAGSDAGSPDEGVGRDSADKLALDELHKRKIDLADYVFVIDVDGYIGESTASEVAYADQHGVPVRFLSEQQWDSPVQRG